MDDAYLAGQCLTEMIALLVLQIGNVIIIHDSLVAGELRLMLDPKVLTTLD